MKTRRTIREAGPWWEGGGGWERKKNASTHSPLVLQLRNGLCLLFIVLRGRRYDSPLLTVVTAQFAASIPRCLCVFAVLNWQTRCNGSAHAHCPCCLVGSLFRVTGQQNGGKEFRFHSYRLSVSQICSLKQRLALKIARVLCCSIVQHLNTYTWLHHVAIKGERDVMQRRLPVLAHQSYTLY